MNVFADAVAALCSHGWSLRNHSINNMGIALMLHINEAVEMDIG